MMQQEQRAAVGPVRIVDEEQHGRAFAEQREEGRDVIEDALALGLRFEQQIGWNIGIGRTQGRGNRDEIGQNAGGDFYLTPGPSPMGRGECRLPLPMGEGRGEGRLNHLRQRRIGRAAFGEALAHQHGSHH